ncbi:MAG: PAS domain S-box protein [Methanospirillum sp.]|uniref:ATP-binding protein n=1 Tax=Methanospirillum sp. TaxID=45200 RepID=UPI00236D7A37|nr:ATP-binding protein [Methanospirillum sp.]MDD1730507.1 PAS domain S-box protein [Methanospirillum sp.]
MVDFLLPTSTYYGWFQNITILISILLIYNVIPSSIYFNNKPVYRILTGLTFSLAAIIAIIVSWSGDTPRLIGLNGILIPIAWYFGGAISGGICIAILFLIKICVGDNEGFVNIDVLLTLAMTLTCILYFVLKNKGFIRLSPDKDLLFFSTCIVSVMFCVFSGMGFIAGNEKSPGIPQIIQIVLVNFLIIVVLGKVIQLINIKNEGQYKLLQYQDHLETQVQERTVDLARSHSLTNAILESSSDGIVTVDLEGNITNYNNTASSIFGLITPDLPQEQLPPISTLISGVSAGDLSVHAELFHFHPDQIDTIRTVVTFKTDRIYEITITPYYHQSQHIGKVLNIRDITDREKAENSIKQINRQLKLLSGITRHDILNKVNTLQLYLDTIRRNYDISSFSDSFEKIDTIVSIIQSQIEFTKVYQVLGTHEPKWQDVTSIIRKVMEQYDVSVTLNLGTYEIYADPLLERVFYNLFDNSLRHGQCVSVIEVSDIRSPDSLTLVFSDNGIGIPSDEKEQIFDLGHGKSSGEGLFFVREILRTTGITISECGLERKGAVFEIVVPKGSFR